MMKVLKKILYVLIGFFALIGLLTTAFCCYEMVTERYAISISENYSYHKLSHFTDMLKQGAFKTDTVQYHFTTVQDTARSREIREYFDLDTLYSPTATTWEKALAISKFVATNVPHDNPEIWPEHFNAIDLWKYTKEISPGLNCRMHSIMNYELMQAAGLTSRYVTCLPQDKDDNDCHVVNEVWLPELGKWVCIDSDMGGNYFTDSNGTPLNLLEIREKYVSDEQMLMHPGFKDATADDDSYYRYMAKNTYWFSSWETLHYFQEDRDNATDKDFGSNRDISIVPVGFAPFKTHDKLVTTDPSKFWSAPY